MASKLDKSDSDTRCLASRMRRWLNAVVMRLVSHRLLAVHHLVTVDDAFMVRWYRLELDYLLTDYHWFLTKERLGASPTLLNLGLGNLCPIFTYCLRTIVRRHQPRILG